MWMKTAWTIMLAACSMAADGAKPRLVVLTDISNEPDDEESLVRLLVYANDFDIEGLVATTSVRLRKTPRPEIIHGHIDAYEKVRENLLLHAKGYPEAGRLKGMVRTGQAGFEMEAVGNGKSTAGRG